MKGRAGHYLLFLAAGCGGLPPHDAHSFDEVSNPVGAGDAQDLLMAANMRVVCFASGADVWCSRRAYATGRPSGVSLGSRQRLPSDVRELHGADRTMCALTRAGEVYCDGLESDTGDLTRVSEFADVRDIAVRSRAVCVVTADAAVRCFGSPRFRSVPNSPTSQWGLELPSRAARIAANPSEWCVLDIQGSVWCAAPGATSVEPVRGVTGAQSLDMGVNFGCAVAAPDGQVMCWGFDGTGAHGVRPAPRSVARSHHPPSRLARRVPGVEAVAQLTVGSGHVCAVTTAGDLWCWGDDGGRTLEIRDGRRAPPRALWQPGRVARAVEDVGTAADETCIRTQERSIICTPNAVGWSLHRIWPRVSYWRLPGQGADRAGSPYGDSPGQH